MRSGSCSGSTRTQRISGLRLASRASRLALRQAEIVRELLVSAHQGLDVEIVPVTTKGDSDRRAFTDIGAKGIFIAEVEREVAEGRADVAVHSAKDVTAELAPGCVIAAVPPRAVVHDVVVARSAAGLGGIAAGSSIGTSSMRRRALLGEARPDVEPVQLRGNLDTRLRKVVEGVVDAAIVAGAGIERLQPAEDVILSSLDPDWWVPAPGQGALALEVRSDRPEVVELVRSISDPDAEAEVACERAFGARIEGGCAVPLGCLARVDGGSVVTTGYLGDPCGERGLRDRISGPASDAERLGAELAEAILAAGGDDIMGALEDERLTKPSPP